MTWRSDAARLLLLLTVSASLASCGASAITRARLERAVARTFANLVQLQLARMGLGPVPPPGIHSAATCRRITPGGDDRGAGEWVCTITWFGPNRTVMLDAYEVAAAADGGQARNVLYAFDGCL